MGTGRRFPDQGFTLLDLLIVLALLVMITALALPGLARARRSANERHAVAGLKTIASAEADFKSNDRDGNKVQDYWVADVAGLYSMTSAAVTGNVDPPLRLIDGGIAAADSAPLAGGAGGENRLFSSLAASAPKSGYWYYALVQDQSTVPFQPYAANTGGYPAMGAVHHPDRFGFLSYPDLLGTTGRRVYAVNEKGAVWCRELTTAIKSTTSVPPGPPLALYRNWPSDADLKSAWTPE